MTDDPVIRSHWHDSLKLGYLAAGESGPAVVLLHGWGAFKELWWSTLLALAPHYRVFAPDFPGHGASQMGRVTDMNGFAEVIAQFCADQGLTEIALVGHSMGGCIAAELALAKPDLVKRLILVDAAVDAYLMPAYIRTYLHPIYGFAALRFTLRIGQFFQPLGRNIPHIHGGGLLRPWLRRSAYLANYDPEAIIRILQGLLAARSGDRLAELQIPTLVVSGQFDGLVPPAHSRRTAQRIPQARYAEIFGASHNPMDERPAAFAKVLKDFLQTTEPKGAV